MKKIKILYWIFTVLFAGFMIFSAIPDVMVVPDAVKMVRDQLGYPEYFIRYIGVLKIIGAITILVPGFPRLKEWAFAGLMFDLISATYSFIAIGTPIAQCAPMAIFIALGFTAYFLYHKKEKASTEYHPAIA